MEAEQEANSSVMTFKNVTGSQESPGSDKVSGTERRLSSSSKRLNVPEVSLRKPAWAYIHLQHLTARTNTASGLDMVTAHLHLTASLMAFLGLHGSAIPVDILAIEGHDVWIRIPAEDRSTLTAAVGGWVGAGGRGWRVKGWSSWSANVQNHGAGQDLFNE